MSHPVHLTFREGEQITIEKIARARRDLARLRTVQLGEYGDRYWVMAVTPEHEYALKDMLISGWPAFQCTFKSPVLPDEIGQVMGFRVVRQRQW